MAIHYYPGAFDAANEQQAKRIILTEEGPGADTESRWTLETPYLLSLIREAIGLQSDMLVIDYGCGIGRMSKAMIEATGCSVIGVDISPSMRGLAVEYVKSDRFLAVSPSDLDILSKAGLRANAAIAVWVLQHCLAPRDEIIRIRNTLMYRGTLFVVNMPKRAVPVLHESDGAPPQFGWVSDGTDVASFLRSTFHVAGEGEPNDPSVPNMADAGAFWMNLVSFHKEHGTPND